MIEVGIALAVVAVVIALVVGRNRRDADPANSVRDFTRALSALERTDRVVGTDPSNDPSNDRTDDHHAAS